MLKITENSANTFQKYTDYGFSTFPIKSRAKEPLCSWKEFQNRIASKTEQKEWIRKYPNSNIAIATGKGVSNLFVVDIDCNEIPIKLQELIGDISKIPTVKTPRGYHLYFMYPDFIIRNKVDYLQHVDIRGDGGYVVAPPSINKDGVEYKWITTIEEAGGIPKAPSGLLSFLKMAPKNTKTLPDDEVSDLNLQREDTYRYLHHGDSVIQQYDILRKAKKGARNDTLFKVACECHRIILKEQLDPEAVVQSLNEIADNIGLERHKSDSTIKSAFSTAMTDTVSSKKLINVLLRSPYTLGYTQTIVENIYGTFYIREYGTNDSENARLFADMYKDKIIYDNHEESWYFRINHLWYKDENKIASVLAILSTEARLFLANAQMELDQREKHVKFATSCKSRQKLVSLLDLAKSMPTLSNDGKGWDKGRNLLPVNNGIIDLRSSAFIGYSNEFRFRTMIPIQYDASAVAPRWMQFLNEIFQDNAEIIDWIQKAVGYTMTGETKEQIFFICHGAGANGKSLFIRMLKKILGSFAYSASAPTFDAQSRQNTDGDLVEMDGKRLVAVSEISDGMHLNETIIKNLSGGDTVNAKKLYKNRIGFEPDCKLWFAVNFKPHINDQSNAIWRRVIAIPFNATFLGKDADPHLEDKLDEELEGILSWAIEGSKRWYDCNQSLYDTMPTLVKSYTDNYRGESDPLRDFFDECIDIGKEYTDRAQSLLSAYTTWANENAISFEHRISSKSFFERLSRMNFDKKRDSKGYFYNGLRVRDTNYPAANSSTQYL